MNLIDNIQQLRVWSGMNRGTPCVLVPTMGALHEGHAALIRAAREIAGHAGNVVVSLFVNPLQFGPNEDFSKYPRTPEEDLVICRENGANILFAPHAEELYRPDRSIQVVETSLSKTLCGASRPRHFDGVCTVVAKLFNLVQCDEAVFGKKDYQQLAIIRRMVRDLDYNIVIHGVDTVRDADGLAMSSRNRYLSADERAQAPALRAALLKAREAYIKGGQRDGKVLRQMILDQIAAEAPLGRVDYVEVVDASTLQTPTEATELVAIAVAVFFGSARLIDNIELK